MKPEKITIASFSPTKGSITCAETVAAAIGSPFGTLDLTRPALRGEAHTFGPQELVIFAAPVYAGRIPTLPEGTIFGSMKGQGTPAILLVSYGNRDFDDALLELYDIAVAQGFCPIGGAACVAPHTFTNRLGGGRPNGKDREELRAFAAQMEEKLREDRLTMDLPTGNRPYKKPMKMPFAPKGTGSCNKCGKCAAVCPTGAIDPKNPTKTDKARCIDCLACVKNCPKQARKVKFVLYPAIVKMLEKKFSAPNSNRFFL